MQSSQSQHSSQGNKELYPSPILLTPSVAYIKLRCSDPKRWGTQNSEGLKMLGTQNDEGPEEVSERNSSLGIDELEPSNSGA